MKRTTMVLGTILFTIILALMPHISAIEYQQVKENQEIIIEEIQPEYVKNFKSFLKEGIFTEDPDGPTEGGHDDITDYLYLLLFLITSPYSIPYIILYFIFGIIAGVSGFISFLLLFAHGIFSNLLFNFWKKIFNFSIFIFLSLDENEPWDFPLRFLDEYHDFADVDGDGS